MKAFAEYIPSAMYFAEAFLTQISIPPFQVRGANVRFTKKQLTNTLQGYIVQNIRIPMRGM